jgi:hypothetical protein
MNDSAAILSRSISPEADPRPDITYRLAVTQEELEQAFALVWKNYVDVGLHKADASGLRLTKYNLLPGSKVFIAVARLEEQAGGKTRTEEKVIGTLTVIQDSCLGLPAEEVCRNHIISLRHQGGRLAEFIALASNQDGKDNRVVMKLFRLAYEYCRRNGIAQIIASLTEHHIGFYRRFMGFRPLGDLREYRMANGTAVQVHQLDVQESFSMIEKRSSALFSDCNWRLFWEQDAKDVLMNAKKMRPWNQDKLQYFSSRNPSFLEQIDIPARLALSLEYERFGCEFSISA